MSGILSKRQQARNEKMLQELVHNVHGNNICADCHSRNPAWASWSLGVFLCMRCAAIHRKLGTHISKVKSLSMDSWSNEQVDNMRKVGNVASNQIYNPENKKPPVPIDADEADSAMERFIRQKYTNNVVSSAGSGKSYRPQADEGVPPPLPPKNSSSKFGLRSASSLFPLSSRSKKEKALPNPGHQRPVSHGSSKASKVFGAAVNYDTGEDMERKLARLKDMGFHDNQRNMIVLKGVNGNLERAIESLIRLGEGDRKSSSRASAAASSEQSSRPARSVTPLSSVSGTGLSIPDQSTREMPMTPSSVSTNPWDSIAPAPPQTAQSTGALHTSNPYNPSLNPFGAPSHQPDAILQALQGLNLQTPQQQLFPNRTGGLVAQNQHQNQQSSFSMQMAPASVTATTHNYQQMPFHNMTYPQPQLQSQQTGYNPFFTDQGYNFQQQQQQSHQGFQSNLTLNTQQPHPHPQPTFSSNPFQRSPTRLGSPTTLGQIPEQPQGIYQAQIPIQPTITGTNPFYAGQTHSPMGPGQNMLAQQVFTPQPQYIQPPRHDKASIMALYKTAQPIIQPQAVSAPASDVQSLQNTPIPEDFAVQPQQLAQPTPQSTTNNPFVNKGISPTAAVAQAGSSAFSPAGPTSRESVILSKDMTWTNGRHSPDAFASLSARHA